MPKKAPPDLYPRPRRVRLYDLDPHEARAELSEFVEAQKRKFATWRQQFREAAEAVIAAPPTPGAAADAHEALASLGAADNCAQHGNLDSALLFAVQAGMALQRADAGRFARLADAGAGKIRWSSEGGRESARAAKAQRDKRIEAYLHAKRKYPDRMESKYIAYVAAKCGCTPEAARKTIERHLKQQRTTR